MQLSTSTELAANKSSVNVWKPQPAQPLHSLCVQLGASLYRSSWGRGWEFLQEGKDYCKWKTLRNLAASQGIKSTYEVEASTTAAVPTSERKRLK